MTVDLKKMVNSNFFGTIFLSRNWKSIQFDKKHLTEPEKSRNEINTINKDIASMPVGLKKL